MAKMLINYYTVYILEQPERFIKYYNLYAYTLLSVTIIQWIYVEHGTVALRW